MCFIVVIRDHTHSISEACLCKSCFRASRGIRMKADLSWDHILAWLFLLPYLASLTFYGFLLGHTWGFCKNSWLCLCFQGTGLRHCSAHEGEGCRELGG